MNLKDHFVCLHQNLSYYQNLRSQRFDGLNYSGCRFDWTAWLAWSWVWWCWTSCDDFYLHISPLILDRPFCALFGDFVGSYFGFGSLRVGLLQHVFYPASESDSTSAAWQKSRREPLQIEHLPSVLSSFCWILFAFDLASARNSGALSDYFCAIGQSQLPSWCFSRFAGHSLYSAPCYPAEPSNSWSASPASVSEICLSLVRTVDLDLKDHNFE